MGDESSPLVTPGGIALSDSEKAEALADTLETQFQPVADPSVPAVEMVDVALRSYFQTPASEPKLTNPDEVHKAIRGLKVGKAPGPNGIPNRGLGTQTANQPKFIPPIISLRHIGTSLAKPVKALSLTSNSLALAYSPVRVKVSVIEPNNAVKRRNG